MNKDIILFSVLFVGWVISLGSACPCPATKKNEDCLRYEIYGVQPNHFILFAALGYKFPEYFYTLQFAGVIWELFEYYVHLDKKLLKLLGGCLQISNKYNYGIGQTIYKNTNKKYNIIDRLFNIKNSKIHGWHHSVAEVLVNIAGFIVGKYFYDQNINLFYLILLCIIILFI